MYGEDKDMQSVSSFVKIYRPGAEPSPPLVRIPVGKSGNPVKIAGH